MGQAFQLGRYTIHFHLSGTLDQSYVRRCSIHHTYNRAVAIHAVHGLRVQDNVAYDNMGASRKLLSDQLWCLPRPNLICSHPFVCGRPRILLGGWRRDGQRDHE